MNHCKFSRIHLREMKYREREEKYFVKIMLDLFFFFLMPPHIIILKDRYRVLD